MIPRIQLIIIVCLTIPQLVLGQYEKIWFPNELNIAPFTANFLEPKAGFEFFFAKEELRLNIGTTTDFYKITDENNCLSFGADFFTYSLLRSEREFHFPVDAIDYLFGVNLGYKQKFYNNECGVRFRLSHISAHFVDGHFDHASDNWRNGRSPQVYSREFVELFPFIKFNSSRIYAGFTYIFNVTPNFLGKEIYQFGFEHYLTNFFNGTINPFAAYDFKLSKIYKFAGSNSFVAGVKFGKYDSKGISIRFSYFSGKSMHGEYYDINENYSTLGFNLEL